MKNLLLLISISLIISCNSNSGKVGHSKTFTIDKEKEFDVFTISGKEYNSTNLMNLQPNILPEITRFGEKYTYISNFSITPENNISFVYDVVLIKTKIRIIDGEYTRIITLNEENEYELITFSDNEYVSVDVNKLQKEITLSEINEIGKATSISTMLTITDTSSYSFNYEIVLNKILVR